MTAAALVAAVAIAGGDVLAESDWDLYALRLVNRARLDPAGEAARIGSSVQDNRASVPPLAYNALVAGAAENHTQWMLAREAATASTSLWFTHYETLDGTAAGAPATGTPFYTGASIGPRVTAAGYAWSWAGENITAAWASYGLPVTADRIEKDHTGWWESTGHRNNMLNANYAVLGPHAQSISITPGSGGLPGWATSLHLATQNFARPLSGPQTYVFGLVYRDLDGNLAWTPRDAADPLREGAGGIRFAMKNAGGQTVATGLTVDNGAFAVNIGNGTYSVVIDDPRGSPLTVTGLTVSDRNVDAGDIRIPAMPGTTGWNATSGSWSDSSRWFGGEPNAGMCAIITNGGAATISQTGRACLILTLGDSPGQSGTVNMTGGSLNTSIAYVGHKGTGTFTQSGGDHHMQQSLFIAEESNSLGTYTLQGGRLFAGQIDVGGSATQKGGLGALTVSGGQAVVDGMLRNWAGSTVSLGLGRLVNSDANRPALDVFNDGLVTVGDSNGGPVVYCFADVAGSGRIVIGPGATLWVQSLEQGSVRIDAGGTLILAEEDPQLYHATAMRNYELAVPEPGSLALTGLGGVLLGWLRRRGA